MRSGDRKDNALDHAVVLCQGKDNEEILRLLRKAGFTKMKRRSRVSEMINRRSGWELGAFGVWALGRALK
jgi:ribosomal protein S18 acetylase RimI-like enzyme